MFGFRTRPIPARLTGVDVANLIQLAAQLDPADQTYRPEVRNLIARCKATADSTPLDGDMLIKIDLSR